MQCKYTESAVLIFSLVFPLASYGSHSLWTFATSIKGKTQFPELSCVVMLNDVSVLYYDADTDNFTARGNTTAEDDVFDHGALETVKSHIKTAFKRRWANAQQNLTETDGVFALQLLVMCELKDDGKPGQMIAQVAFEGVTINMVLYADNNVTFHTNLILSKEEKEQIFENLKYRHKTVYQPFCYKTLKGYLEKRKDQVNRKVNPEVRLFYKANSVSGGFLVSCLATGFYPRHINLTLLRDGQPVSDHEVTGGDLLPNGDGTYQMRKSLEIRAEEREKHKYTCSAKHLGKEYHIDLVEPGPNHMWIAIGVSVLLVCAIIVGLVVYIGKRGQKDRTAGQTE